MKLLTVLQKSRRAPAFVALLLATGISACATSSSDRSIASAACANSADSQSCEESEQQKALDESLKYGTFHQNFSGSNR